jgi:hypothetical protein
MKKISRINSSQNWGSVNSGKPDWQVGVGPQIFLIFISYKIISPQKINKIK